jgi:hypothetical protein
MLSARSPESIRTAVLGGQLAGDPERRVKLFPLDRRNEPTPPYGRTVRMTDRGGL